MGNRIKERKQCLTPTLIMSRWKTHSLPTECVSPTCHNLSSARPLDFVRRLLPNADWTRSSPLKFMLRSALTQNLRVTISHSLCSRPTESSRYYCLWGCFRRHGYLV